MAQSQNLLLASASQGTAPTPATLSLSLLDTLDFKDPDSATVKQLAG